MSMRIRHETFTAVTDTIYVGLMTNLLLVVGCLPLVVGLLATDPAVGMTRLRWLETGPVEASPAAVKAEVAKRSSCVRWACTPWICRCCRRSDAGFWRWRAPDDRAGAGPS